MTWQLPFDLPPLPDQQSLDDYKNKLFTAADSAKEQALKVYADAQGIDINDYKERTVSLALSVKDKVSWAYGNAQAISADGYRERGAALAESAMAKVFRIYVDAQAIDLYVLKERAAVLVESVMVYGALAYDDGRVQALQLYMNMVAPVIGFIGDGMQRVADIAAGAFESVSITQAFQVAFQGVIGFIASLAAEHPYIIGYTLFSVGLHPLLDVFSIVSRLAFLIVWFFGIVMRGGSITPRYGSGNPDADGVSRGYRLPHIQWTGTSTVVETLLWPLRVWLGVQGAIILIKAMLLDW